MHRTPPPSALQSAIQYRLVYNPFSTHLPIPTRKANMNLLLHLLPLLSFAAAGAPLNHKLFKLRVSTDGPYGIAGKYVSTTGTSLGLYTNKPDFQGYIDAADPGILHSAVDPGKKVYVLFLFVVLVFFFFHTHEQVPPAYARHTRLLRARWRPAV